MSKQPRIIETVHTSTLLECSENVKHERTREIVKSFIRMALFREGELYPSKSEAKP